MFSSGEKPFIPSYGFLQAKVAHVCGGKENQRSLPKKGSPTLLRHTALPISMAFHGSLLREEHMPSAFLPDIEIRVSPWPRLAVSAGKDGFAVSHCYVAVNEDCGFGPFRVF